MKHPPNIQIEVLGDAPDAKPFIKTERNLCKISYPDGTVREMVLDSITRTNPDASVIIPWTMKSVKGWDKYVLVETPHVWLRSCLRTAASIRANKDPDFEYTGNLWELPAGIIDPGETPQEAAKRECFEEAGFDEKLDNFKHLSTTLSMPSLIAERLYFYAVKIDNSTQVDPTLDGSPLEEGAELICVPLDEALSLSKSGKIPDMKTSLGLRFLAEHIG